LPLFAIKNLSNSFWLVPIDEEEAERVVKSTRVSTKAEAETEAVAEAEAERVVQPICTTDYFMYLVYSLQMANSKLIDIIM
jgi:hypothetical protein